MNIRFQKMSLGGRGIVRLPFYQGLHPWLLMVLLLRSHSKKYYSSCPAPLNLESSQSNHLFHLPQSLVLWARLAVVAAGQRMASTKGAPIAIGAVS
jgi:hypothetical protein